MNEYDFLRVELCLMTRTSLGSFLPKNEDCLAHNLLPCPVGTQLHVGGRDGRGWLLCEAISSGLTGFVPEWVLEKAEPNSQPSSIVVHSPKSALAEHRAESTNNRPGKHIGKVCRIEAMTGAYVDAWLHKKLVQVCDSSHVCVQTMVLVDAIPF
eukprot:g10411.t1